MDNSNASFFGNERATNGSMERNKSRYYNGEASAHGMESTSKDDNHQH